MARVLAVLLAGACSTLAAPLARPLERAHAHNDYEHPRPLLDALDHGFCSVEADVHLVEGRLLVAHDRIQVRPERTLEALYLEPLRQRVLAHGGGVYPGGPTFWLLIDFKSEGASTWRALEPILERYRPWLTTFDPHATHTNAITVVLSGNAPREELELQTHRLAALDGRVPDLATDSSRHLIPWISASWSSQFQWRGMGPFPPAEQARLEELVARTQAQGRRLRFWGAPDREAVWRVQWHAGVDWINTDRLADLAAFLQDPR